MLIHNYYYCYEPICKYVNILFSKRSAVVRRAACENRVQLTHVIENIIFSVRHDYFITYQNRYKKKKKTRSIRNSYFSWISNNWKRWSLTDTVANYQNRHNSTGIHETERRTFKLFIGSIRTIVLNGCCCREHVVPRRLVAAPLNAPITCTRTKHVRNV